MAFRGHALGVVSAAALVLALAGCGDDQPSPEPQLGDSPTEETSSGSTEPTSTAPTGTEEPFDTKGGELHRGLVKTDGAAEEAVAEAWLAYWEVRGKAYHQARVDADALGEVAQGDAVEEVIAYVSELQADGGKLEGDTLVGISDIEVSGSSAAVQSCLQSKADFVGAGDGGIDYATSVGTLEKVGGQWLVTSKTVTGDQRCKA